MYNDNFLDTLTVIGFVVGLMNYQENVDQSTLQEEMQKVVDVIDKHLREQDKKIDLLLERVGGDSQ